MYWKSQLSKLIPSKVLTHTLFKVLISPEPRSIISNVLRDCISTFQQQKAGFPLILVATTHNLDGVSAPLRACFRHEVKVDVPAQVQREAYLTKLLHGLPYSRDVSLKELSLMMASFSRKDIHHMFLRATENAIARISKHNLYVLGVQASNIAEILAL